MEPIHPDLIDLCEKNKLHLIASKNIESPNGVIDGKDLFGQITELQFT
jgi:hypothetical protein